VAAVVAAGSRVAVELEGRRARARVDSAATSLGLGARVAERTLERTSLYMGARPVPDRDGADYLLEVDVRSLALDVRGDRARLRCMPKWFCSMPTRAGPSGARGCEAMGR
jgi:hypothetical protein